MIKVTLKDGGSKEFESGITLGEIAKSLNHQLGKSALLAVVDGQNKDLSDKLTQDAKVEFVTPDTPEGLHELQPFYLRFG